MDKYVDGFLLPVPRSNLDTYRQMAMRCGDIWKAHGALAYVECVGDELQVKDMVPFTQSSGATDEEVVIFAWIIYKSKAHRDEVNKAVMADPRMKDMMDPNNHAFDCKRMAYGGFNVLVDY
ncbi:DUF1428 domain-containing protein [Chitinivorax sp. B]|uniref:DUF1428 domain-containing protein n=1 Tax=Chitinivorax sp. B TaxID=2502235 RepID=UPI0010F8F65B|nr:DUF1428 domain-containing protein [Chitinivorax sp. B]